MGKKKKKRNGMSLTKRGIVTAVAAIMLMVQPGLSFPSLADEYNEYYDTEQRLIRTVATYDNGSKKENNYTYRDGVLVAEKKYEYDGNKKSGKTTTVEYGEGGFPAYRLIQNTLSDGSTQSIEEWNIGWNTPIKSVIVNWSGSTVQTEYTYNEAGERSYYKTIYYDPQEQKQDIYEVYYGVQEYGAAKYHVSTIIYADGTQDKTETWFRSEDNKETRCVTTHRDGLQDVEERFYNSDGRQNLYTRVSSDGSTARYATTYTNTGSISIHTDSEGEELYIKEDYDSKNGVTTKEERHTYSEGTVYDSKTVSSDDQSFSSLSEREIAADGTEIYVEIINDSNGRVVTQKMNDGIVLMRRFDRDKNLILAEDTMPDGTVTTVDTTRDADDNILSETRRYPDGGEDYIEYGYDASGDRIKQTEVRRNGVTAVTDYQYTDGKISHIIIRFNNGYQLTTDYTKTDDETRQAVFTYNSGEVFQDTRVYQKRVGLVGKRTYSDGRVEDIQVDFYAEDFIEQYKAWSKLIGDHRRAFLETAWSTPPIQTE